MKQNKIPPNCSFIIYTFLSMNFNYKIISNLSKKERENAQIIKDLIRDNKLHGNLILDINDHLFSLVNLLYLYSFSYKFTLTQTYKTYEYVNKYYEYFISSIPKYIGERITLKIDLQTSDNNLFNQIRKWESYHKTILKIEILEISTTDLPCQLYENNFCYKADILKLNNVTLNKNAKQLIRLYENSSDQQRKNQIFAELTQYKKGYDKKYNFEKVIIRNSIIVDPRDIQSFRNTKVLKLINVVTNFYVRQKIQNLQNLVKYQFIKDHFQEDETYSKQTLKHFDIDDFDCVSNLLKLKNVQSFTLTIGCKKDLEIFKRQLKQVKRKIMKVKLLIKTPIEIQEILRICKSSQYVQEYVIITTQFQLDFSPINKCDNFFRNFYVSSQNLEQNILELIGQNEINDVNVLFDVTQRNKIEKIRINILIKSLLQDDRQTLDNMQVIDIRFQDFINLKSKLQINF